MIITPESADIMRLLEMGASELDMPMRLSMFDSVYKYFKGYDLAHARREILNVLAKSQSKDSLTAIWRYIELQNDRKEILQGLLNTAQFDAAVEQEIEQGFISKEKAEMVRNDIKVRRAKNDSSFSKDSLNEVETKLDTIALINQELAPYGA